MRVLLVYANSNRELVASPPVGLSYVASATRDAGHDVSFLDLLFSRQPASDLRRVLRSFRPEAVGFSVRNIDNLVRQRVAWQLDGLSRLLAVVREESQAPIVLGGPAISILGPGVLARLDADFAVVGEGEQSFPKLLGALGASPSFSGVSGLSWREGDRIRTTPPVPLPSFGRSGMEAWIDWPAYERAGGTWAIQTKRGCPLGCTYCAYSATEGHGLRRRTAPEVVDEIEQVAARIGPRSFEIVDSTLNVPAQHTLDLCREILRRKLRLNLTAQGLNPLDTPDQLFPLMKQAGFNAVMITPEAASDTMLRNLRKGFTMEHVHRCQRLARESGISCFWFFMLGGPGETQATVEETVSFVEQHLTWKGCLSLFMTGVRILPGTELARQAVAQGELAADADLYQPQFYLSPQVTEEWVLRRINGAISRHSNIVHAAEEGTSVLERLLRRALHLAGVPPPHWRFLPALLSFSPLRLARRHFPALVDGRAESVRATH
ncbi:MAG TPA: radical SAM protein [Vicinamibacteria bacterium]|nr:radical SAM protein [Vicinamibacteria bacterium]